MQIPISWIININKTIEWFENLSGYWLLAYGLIINIMTLIVVICGYKICSFDDSEREMFIWITVIQFISNIVFIISNEGLARLCVIIYYVILAISYIVDSITFKLDLGQLIVCTFHPVLVLVFMSMAFENFVKTITSFMLQHIS